MLNLLLESERAGVAVLDSLAAEVRHPELKDLLLDAREEERRNAATLERLVGEGGGTASAATGPFAAKVAAVTNMRGRLALLIRGQEWVARKIEETKRSSLHRKVVPSASPCKKWPTAIATK